jgi:hypothetical protein
MHALRDILYAIEHYDAREIYPIFSPARHDWIEREPFPRDGCLKSDVLQNVSHPRPEHREFSRSLDFLKEDDMTITSQSCQAGRRLHYAGSWECRRA